ncbi:unnamed protein product [Durusdinium trenchii]|uniref:Concentrative nucleoside transporter C-terminal domain-containing protein n=1 Tax=Durusdinium trenchii TaxID=1381693 RepID=A0ABP0SZ79_9DINO
MSCPAALAMAKLSYPETEISRTNDLKAVTSDGSGNVLDAMATGVITGISLAGTIAGMLIAFVAAMAFLNAALEWTGELVGLQGLTFDLVMSYAMWPLAFMMGVPQEDCLTVGLLIGQKTVLNALGGTGHKSHRKSLDRHRFFCRCTVYTRSSWPTETWPISSPRAPSLPRQRSSRPMPSAASRTLPPSGFRWAACPSWLPRGSRTLPAWLFVPW